MATIIERGPAQFQVKIRRKDANRKILTRTFTTKTDAQKWARSVESELDRGVFIDRVEAEKNTLGDVLKRYAEEIVPHKKGEAVEALRVAAIRRDKIAAVKMAALTSAVLADYRNRRLKTVSGSTVNRELNLISHAINTAKREWGINIENPVADVRRPPNGKARDRRLELGEEERLLATLDTPPRRPDGKIAGPSNTWIKPLVQLALETAMRRGELLALRWENVDLQKCVAHLPDTKNGEARNIPLSSRAIKLLETLPRSIDGKVFPTTEDALKKAFTRACARAEIENLHFHDLRHEATSRLAERLPNLIELAAVTGHKDLRMLKRYYHPRAEDLAKKLG